MSETVSKDSNSSPSPVTPNARPSDATISARILALALRIESGREAILKEMHLLPGQDSFLLALLATDGITMGSLAESLGISASSATKAAIKLEAAGLIRREASRVDSRQNYAFLTPPGREKAREIISAYEKLDVEVFAKLKDKGSERLLKLLDRLEKSDIGAGKQPRKARAKKSGKNKDKKPKSKKKNKKEK